MPGAGLQLEQAPPFSVPLRFFLSAPVFVLLAAIVLVWQGPEALGSRWTPAALALTHLLTLGFMAMAMLGALMQILPVLAGAPLPWPRVVAGITHVAILLGTLALSGGFLWSEPLLLQLAFLLLAGGFAVFVAGAAGALVQAKLQGAIASELWFPVAALAVTVVLGLYLDAARAWNGLVLAQAWRELHPAWALAGWTGVLVAAVAKQVVPMFQMTPSYPSLASRYFSVAVFALLVAWSAAQALPDSRLAIALGLVLSAAYLVFALATLELQRRRRRRVGDTTLQFWRVGMISLALAALLWASRMAGLAPERFDAALGVLAIVGAAMSLINGMLYKIVPFLAWFHLQAIGAGRRGLSMKSFLAEAPQRRQFAMHLIALVLLLGAACGPVALVYPAAACLGLSAVLLFSNLMKVVGGYRAMPRPATSEGARTPARSLAEPRRAQ